MGVNDRKQDAAEARRDKRGSARPADADWRGYVNVSLSEGDKAGLADWLAAYELSELLSACVLAGVTLSVKYLAHDSCCLASGTVRDSASVNYGYTVTARAGNPLTALERLLYSLSLVGLDTEWATSPYVVREDRW